eukprot:gene18351-biopygen11453
MRARNTRAGGGERHQSRVWARQPLPRVLEKRVRLALKRTAQFDSCFTAPFPRRKRSRALRHAVGAARVQKGLRR